MNECKKEKNRFLVSLIIVLIFTFLFFRGIVLAATVYTEGDFYYELQDEAITITGYFGLDSEVTVPSVIAGYPVSVIEKGAFTENDTVKTINLPDTIMEIQEGAIAQGITVTYMSNTEKPIQSEPDIKDPTEQKEDYTDSNSGNDETVADKTHLGEVEEVEINLLDDSTKDEKNAEDDSTVTIQNQNEEKVYVDSDGTIKASENTIAKIEKDGTVKNESQKNMIWVVIIAILVVLGIICVAALIVRKKKRAVK